MERFLEKLMVAGAGLVILAFFAALLGLPVMWLWDWLMPELFGLKEITFWQAVGVNLLCGILFRTNISKED